MERTLVILKPDAVKRGLIGEIVGRFEKRDLKITNIKMMSISRETAEVHYAHVKTEPIFERMIDYIVSGPVVVLTVEGERVIQIVRSMIGRTKAFDSPPGTIRGDLGSHDFENLVHASDSPESAELEIDRFFF